MVSWSILIPSECKNIYRALKEHLSVSGEMLFYVTWQKTDIGSFLHPGGSAFVGVSVIIAQSLDSAAGREKII